ncbi:hypothetical protein [Bifidobacterium vansinderenii]|nr:hypothetical protein [Bifidobacterium vansinderenii]
MKLCRMTRGGGSISPWHPDEDYVPWFSESIAAGLDDDVERVTREVTAMLLGAWVENDRFIMNVEVHRALCRADFLHFADVMYRGITKEYRKRYVDADGKPMLTAREIVRSYSEYVRYYVTRGDAYADSSLNPGRNEFNEILQKQIHRMFNVANARLESDILMDSTYRSHGLLTLRKKTFYCDDGVDRIQWMFQPGADEPHERCTAPIPETVSDTQPYLGPVQKPLNRTSVKRMLKAKNVALNAVPHGRYFLVCIPVHRCPNHQAWERVFNSHGWRWVATFRTDRNRRGFDCWNIYLDVGRQVPTRSISVALSSVVAKDGRLHGDNTQACHKPDGAYNSITSPYWIGARQQKVMPWAKRGQVYWSSAFEPEHPKTV